MESFQCILSAIIIVTVQRLIMQVKDFKKFLKRSKMDALIWSATLATVVFVAIDIGLLVGIVLNILGLLHKTLKPHVCILGQVSGTDLYLDVDKFKKAIELSRTKIYRYSGNINFATKSMFRDKMCKKLQLNLQQELRNVDDESTKYVDNYFSYDHLIIDFTALTFIDASSVSMLNTLIEDFIKIKINVSIAGCSSKVYETLSKNNFLFMDNLYPTIHDAVKHVNLS